MSEEVEVWKDVLGYEGLYEVSNFGNIRNNRGKILSYKPGNNGYVRVILRKNGTEGRLSIHRLVAQAFIENPENKPEVDHINRIKNDNRVINLRWAYSHENRQNVGIFSSNTSGTSGICETADKRYGYKYWKIQFSSTVSEVDENGNITLKKKKIQKLFRYKLEEEKDLVKQKAIEKLEELQKEYKPFKTLVYD